MAPSSKQLARADMHHPPLRTIPIWSIGLALSAFAILAWFTYGPGVIRGDEMVLDWIQQAPARPWQSIADVGNLIGETETIPIVLLGLCTLSIARKSIEAAVFCISALILRIGGMFLKSLFDSPRPTVEFAHIRDRFDSTGFPSGHAQTSTLVAGAVSIVAGHLFPESRMLKPVTLLFWLWAVACWFARIWYGAHWPSDVLGGILVSIVILGLSTRIATALPPKTNNQL